MNFSKQYLNELSLKTNFIKDNIEKVLRLTDILKFINMALQTVIFSTRGSSNDVYGSPS